MTANLRRYAIIGVIAALVIILVIYTIFDPSTMPFPRCPFLTVSGLKCPGCGSQRVLHALLHADIAEAWRQNAFMVASLPFVALLLVAQFGRNRYPRLYNSLNSRVVIIAVAVAIIAWWIMRNIFNL